jgi:hypothetical protein
MKVKQPAAARSMFEAEVLEVLNSAELGDVVEVINRNVGGTYRSLYLRSENTSDGRRFTNLLSGVHLSDKGISDSYCITSMKVFKNAYVVLE